MAFSAWYWIWILRLNNWKSKWEAERVIALPTPQNVKEIVPQLATMGNEFSQIKWKFLALTFSE